MFVANLIEDPLCTQAIIRAKPSFWLLFFIASHCPNTQPSRTTPNTADKSRRYGKFSRNSCLYSNCTVGVLYLYDLLIFVLYGRGNYVNSILSVAFFHGVSFGYGMFEKKRTNFKSFNFNFEGVTYLFKMEIYHLKQEIW